MKHHLLLIATLSLTACATDFSETTDEVSAAQCAAASTWTAWKTYATGDVITYNGTYYQCVQGHTTQPDRKSVV